MNKSIRRMATLVTAMFLVLMVATTAVQFFQAASLDASPFNARRRMYRDYGRHRGPLVAGGVVIAESVPVDSPFRFQRIYSAGDPDQAAMWAPVTGFFSIVHGTSMLESSQNQWLTGQANAQWVTRIQDLLTGRETQGASVEITIDPAIQEAAWRALGDQRGAVVVVEVDTGRILAMVSTPSYDPNRLAALDTALAGAAWDEFIAADGDPMINRALGALYPPGSSFKLIPAAAALETGYLTSIDADIPAPHRFTIPGTTHQMQNFGDAVCSPTDEMSMRAAMTMSCNTSFAQLAVNLGAQAFITQAERFGLGDAFTVPMTSATSRINNLDALTPDRLALAGIGQGDVVVTPLQMAMISQAIANNGVMMQPQLVDRIRNAELEIIHEFSPSQLRVSVTTSTASALRAMMDDAVNAPGATGGAARIAGVSVAGKTGTAEWREGYAPHTWFTGFAPVDNPRVAIAVVVEEGGALGMAGTGGSVAAPIASQVLQAVFQP